MFYPRYFEMINDAVEALFSDLLGWLFEEMHHDSGVPTASFKVEFKASSRHGDHLDLNLTVTDLGRSSMTLRTEAVSEGQVRIVADQVLVCVNGDGRPKQWPVELRETVKTIMEG